MTTFKKNLIAASVIVIFGLIASIIVATYFSKPEIIYKDECEPCKVCKPKKISRQQELINQIKLCEDNGFDDMYYSLFTRSYRCIPNR